MIGEWTSTQSKVDSCVLYKVGKTVAIQYLCGLLLVRTKEQDQLNCNVKIIRLSTYFYHNEGSIPPLSSSSFFSNFKALYLLCKVAGKVKAHRPHPRIVKVLLHIRPLQFVEIGLTSTLNVKADPLAIVPLTCTCNRTFLSKRLVPINHRVSCSFC